MIALRLVLAALVLGAGAAAGGAFRTPPAAGSEEPRNAVIAVGDALEVNGQPMRLSLFSTPEPPARVVSQYTAAFLDRGLLPVTAAGHVAVFDPRDGLQHFISALPQPGGQTLVLVGTADPRKVPNLSRGAASAGFPVPPTSRAFLGYRSEDAGAHAETGQFVTSQSADGVAAFYRKELAALGFHEARSTPGLLSFARKGSTISVGIQALDTRSGAAVFVTRREGGPTR